ncbi:ATP-binding cassette domain-containing protein [Enterobacter mori]|uniref:ATP-binding cassette domain-containing protein n=1 Tax=Enterobacter mori TaxID=539813 RepID=UPI002DBD1473|nr:ABC transporter ATP-binding protein [Enterobacter mori]MEB7918575.1 ABC transporter ATP-binding protein [Enterobacter mori]
MYLDFNNVEVNLDNTYNYVISKDNSSLSLIPDKNSIPDDFFSKNININCFVGRNGSGKSLIMHLLNSLRNGINEKTAFEKSYKVVFVDSEGFFYLLAVENSSHTLSRGVVTKKNNNQFIDFQNVDIKYLDQYNSYYLSSNNTNMMKSWIENIDNDYSVGNERRYKGLHSLVEISQFIQALPFENELSDICNSKSVRLLITDRWLSQLNLRFLPVHSYNRSDFTSLVKRVKKIGRDGFIILARLILLRVISSNAHKKNSVLHPLSDEKYSVERSEINSFYLEAITRLEIQDMIEFDLFDNEYHEGMAAVLSEIIKCRANEMEIEFNILNHKHITLLKYLLDISMTNEAIADGYKYYFYPPFSTGQWKRVEMVCKINHLYNDIKDKRCVNIFMDEPDADLHPEVQTNLILWLVNIMKDKDIYFNIIISSHNPLILSDFPRRKITYIGGDISTNKIGKTLGANIYNLYKNNFLVNNVIGDFIKNKIEHAVDSNNVAELSFLINEVSEPLLVKSLTSHLNKILNFEDAQNLRVISFIDGLSLAEKDFLKRKLQNEL